MTPSDRAAAQAALTEGRPVYGRLDQIRGPEDAAADIMELWAASEKAMRAMLGGSTLAGQALVRELRQRDVLGLEQANALASFWDARSRADDVAYKPTLTDVGFARAGYNELTRAVDDLSSSTPNAEDGSTGSPAASTFAPGGATAPPRTVTVPVDAVAPEPVSTSAGESRASRIAMIVVGVLLVIIVAVAAAYFTMGNSMGNPMGSSKFNGEMSNAINLMTTGRTEAARAAFGALAHEYPDRAEPHVFLSRLARNDTPPDMNTAKQELITAIRLDPTYAPAQREMGIFQLVQHNPSLARNFLIRAAQLNPADSAAQGYLGCALMQLNRADEAQKFFARAGTGTWSSCVTIQPTPATPAGP